MPSKCLTRKEKALSRLTCKFSAEACQSGCQACLVPPQNSPEQG